MIYLPSAIQSRSALNFFLFFVFALSTAIFVINKATGAIAEINVLGDSTLLVSERYVGGTWKTYSSEKHKFSIKYPRDWDVSTNPSYDPYFSMTLSDPNYRSDIIFPSFSLGIAVPGLRCNTPMSNTEFKESPSLVIGDSEYFRTCLNLSIADKRAVAICDFIRSNSGFIKICNKIFDSIRVLK